MDALKKYLYKKWIGLAITLVSIFVVSMLHLFGIFDILELKSYDYRFTNVRGPLTGWAASDSTYINMGTDVVLLEVDDEAWRLMPETWPYPRGTVWAKVIRNLAQAGAKVIAFDIQFDAPETKSEYLHEFANKIDSDDLRQLIPRHGDKILAEAIREARAYNTEVIINAKMVNEPNRRPSQYIAEPVEEIMKAEPETGLINDQLDDDAFSRRYAIFGEMSHQPGRYYLTLGVKAVKLFLGISDTTIPRFDPGNHIWNYGDLKIHAYGNSNTFLVNYYGPASGYKLQTEEDYPAWGTFPRYSLAYVIDTEDVDLRDPLEDIDWMSQFLPGQIPEWIEAIENPDERQEMMEIMGVGGEFDVTKTPFYNKVVIIGVAVEVIHDVKSTPFYNYLGVQQITPGMETHANAIQTMIHDNYLNVVGSRFTNLLFDPQWSHVLIILILALIAFFLLDTVNPIVAGVLIIIEILFYYALVCGLFVDDMTWFIKSTMAAILPDTFVKNNFSWFSTGLPSIQSSLVVPMIAPIASILVTYLANVLYRFLIEQKDKKFLKSTFGQYISPELIDKMFDNKQEPKLGGETGVHTAFFSDIQSFSSFTEVLEPEKMVKLMNEYLTEMTNVLLSRNGTLDKYIGDAIVAFYGAPVPVEDHEYQACMTALDMKDQLENLREKWSSEEGWPEIVHNMQHRIGLSSGRMVTGNMGSTMRMNYTMMGDTVNLAARLEASAKQYGIYIQVSESTYKVVKDKFDWRFLDYVRVKGKQQPVKVYELIAKKGKMNDIDKAVIEAFSQAQELYFKQDWDNAINGFKEGKALEDMFPGRSESPSNVYLKRCYQLKENPPGKDWDGIWVLTKK